MGIHIFLSRNKHKIKIYKLLLSLIFLLIILFLILLIKNPSKFQNIFPNLSFLDIESSSILTEDTLVNEIRNVNKLIPLEIELSETLTIDNTYFNLDILRKSKTITFFATCSYAIDFSTLSSNNIEFNNSTSEIIITIPKIDIFSIDVDESKTIYEETQVGLLRFGDLKLSSEELNNIYEQLYDMFSRKMNNTQFYNQVLLNTENSLEELFSNLTGNNYNITLKLSNS